ncbi:hypothetical protein HK096_010248 [Nowakowskiella sp. JEL0078]|nr:hypothetical protein HK096_010248 [Nowakowskiella sp. JEL0078]
MLNGEIVAKEGVTAFSCPLVISRAQDFLALAQYFVEAYDVSYNPYCEFSIDQDGSWNLIKIYRDHVGLKIVGTDLDDVQRDTFLANWASDLIHYADIGQSVWKDSDKFNSHL